FLFKGAKLGARWLRGHEASAGDRGTNRGGSSSSRLAPMLILAPTRVGIWEESNAAIAVAAGAGHYARSLPDASGDLQTLGRTHGGGDARPVSFHCGCCIRGRLGRRCPLFN